MLSRGSIVNRPHARAGKSALKLVAHCLRQAREAVRLEDLGGACAQLNEGDFYAEYLSLTDRGRYEAAAEKLHKRMVRIVDWKMGKT